MKLKKYIKFIVLGIGYMLHYNRKSKVIYYHDLHDNIKYTNMSTPFKLFTQHVKFLIENKFEIVHNITRDENQIKITFDDGWVGIYEFKDYFINNNIPVTIFIVSDFIDKDNYLSKSMILEMNKYEVFSFQSHTKSHPTLTLIDLNDSMYELLQGKKDLEAILGSEISDICFPRGRFNDEIIKCSTVAGFRKLYTSIPGTVSSQHKLISRCIAQNKSIIEFKWLTYGAQEVFKDKIKSSHKHDFN